MKYEQKTWAPLWLELSGLPEFLGEKVKGGWPVFKKIVELDCVTNPLPGIVEISIRELGQRSGVSAEATRRAIVGLRKHELVTAFLPDNDEEEALLRVRTPLKTPLSPEELRRLFPHWFGQEGHFFRYAETPQDELDALDPEDPLLKEIVDLYFNTVGLKMNAFILDELRLMRQQFPIDLVRRTFRRAGQNEIRSLQWVMRELIRQKRKLDEKAGEEPENLPEM